jgi:ubiquinone/menaquinone biosynthesis C-methylase UbiE
VVEVILTAANNAAIQQWTNRPCGALEGFREPSLEYFEAVERNRYEQYAPWMRSFVNFDGYAGKKILEVGVGQGTDLLQFAKGGAKTHGIDITPRHLELATRNFSVHGLPCDLRYAAAAAIPYEQDTFDVVYSFGVLHHTDDIERCIAECHRVLKPGGEFTLGVYNRFSLFHAYTILVNGILRGGLWRFGYNGLMSRIESGADGVEIAPLVRTYSRRQLRKILRGFGKVQLGVQHLSAESFGSAGRLVPDTLRDRAARHVGWYLFARATK